MGIEEDIEDILFVVKEINKRVQDNEAKIRDLNEKVDLLTIRNKVANRSDNEKRIKDTLNTKDILKMYQDANKENRS